MMTESERWYRLFHYWKHSKSFLFVTYSVPVTCFPQSNKKAGVCFTRFPISADRLVFTSCDIYSHLLLAPAMTKIITLNPTPAISQSETMGMFNLAGGPVTSTCLDLPRSCPLEERHAHCKLRFCLKARRSREFLPCPEIYSGGSLLWPLRSRHSRGCHASACLAPASLTCDTRLPGCNSGQQDKLQDFTSWVKVHLCRLL